MIHIIILINEEERGYLAQFLKKKNMTLMLTVLYYLFCSCSCSCQVADGARDFDPTPAMVRSAAGKAYRARRTLILGYDDDPIDESDEVEEVLREARSITRMRRPMVEIDVQRISLSGGHVAPLLAPPLDVAGRAEDLLGLETSQERLGYREAAATVEALVRWLDEGNL